MKRCIYNSRHCVYCRRPIPPEGRHAVRECAPRGLGDMVAAGLNAVGITKARVQAVASAVGIKDCGCAERQQRLNELGQKLGFPPGLDNPSTMNVKGVRPMPRKPRTAKAAPAAPQFDDAPLADDDEEGPCPIPDEDGNIVLRRSKPATKERKRGKGKADKPAR